MLQLELDLWSDLERAKSAPVELDFDGLLEKIDRTVARTEGDRKLAIAGEAIERIAGVWQLRAEGLLLNWRDRFEGARLDEDWLARWRVEDEPFDLAKYEVALETVRKPRVKGGEGESQVEVVDKEVLLAWADERELEISTMDEVVQLAHEESIQEWAEAIAWVLEKNEGKATLQMLVEESEVREGRRSLVWVEVVLGSLFSQEPGFRLQGGRTFYGERDRVWVTRQIRDDIHPENPLNSSKIN